MRVRTGRFNVDEQTQPKRARFAQWVPGTNQALLKYNFCMNELYVSVIEVHVTKRAALNEQS
jgi:hypothetical protein